MRGGFVEPAKQSQFDGYSPQVDIVLFRIFPTLTRYGVLIKILTFDGTHVAHSKAYAVNPDRRVKMKRLILGLVEAVLLLAVITLGSQPATASARNNYGKRGHESVHKHHHQRQKHRRLGHGKRVPNARSLRKESW